MGLWDEEVRGKKGIGVEKRFLEMERKGVLVSVFCVCGGVRGGKGFIYGGDDDDER